MKLLILLPFWEGDKEQAMLLARLLADLEPSQTGVDFLFVPRFDCEQDEDTLDYVGKKFRTSVFKSDSQVAGWPEACNTQTFDSFRHIQQLSEYDVILKLGADSVPLVREWREALLSRWEKFSGFVAGAMVEADGRTHINGDCILLSGDPGFLKWLVESGPTVPNNVGWEWWLNEDLKRWGWADFPVIKSEWRRASFTSDEWEKYREAGVIFLHGVKDFSLLSLVREKLL